MSKKKKFDIVQQTVSQVYNSALEFDVVNGPQEVFQSAREFKSMTVKHAKTVRTAKPKKTIKRSVSQYEDTLGHLEDYALVGFLAMQLKKSTQREAFQASLVIKHAKALDDFFKKFPTATLELDLGKVHKDGSTDDPLSLDKEDWTIIKSTLAPACLWRYESTEGQLTTRARGKRSQSKERAEFVIT